MTRSGCFGGSPYAEVILARRRARVGELVNYLDHAHYDRVVYLHRLTCQHARPPGEAKRPPPAPPHVRCLDIFP